MSYDYRDDPILGPALSYWMSKRGERSMPRKRDIDPTDIPPKILPNLQIIEVINGGARFRYRLIGTALVDAYGKDFSGLIVDELFPDGRLDFVQGLYRSVCSSKAPIFSRNKYHTPRNVDLFSTRIYMPLSEDDLAVQNILGVMRFEYGATVDEGLWDMQATPEWHHTEAVDIGSPATSVP